MNEIDKLRAKASEGKVYDDRSKAAIEFLLKTVLGFSGAIVALFFLALTTKIDPPLTPMQSRLALSSIATQAGAIFAVLLYAYITYKHNARRARIVMTEASDIERLEKYRRSAASLHKARRVAIVLLLLLFLFGLASAIAFLLSRIP